MTIIAHDPNLLRRCPVHDSKPIKCAECSFFVPANICGWRTSEIYIEAERAELAEAAE